MDHAGYHQVRLNRGSAARRRHGSGPKRAVRRAARTQAGHLPASPLGDVSSWPGTAAAGRPSLATAPGRATRPLAGERRLEGEQRTEVLLIEDDPAIAEVLTIALSEAGHRVRHARSRADVLAQGGPRRHDVILTDGLSQRSSTSGLEPDERDWLRLLAAHAPVVVLTAS